MYDNLFICIIYACFFNPLAATPELEERIKTNCANQFYAKTNGLCLSSEYFIVKIMKFIVPDEHDLV